MDKKDNLEVIRKAMGDDSIQEVKLDDTFNFKCQQCGKCCMNRTDIIINPFDVYNGARYLGITPTEFIKEYCFTDLGAHSKIPIVLLATTENGFCPLLKYDVKDGGKFKCSINPAKPGVCANHPIGLAHSTDVSTGEQNTTFIKVEQCPHSVSDEKQVVRDWIKPYLDHQEEIVMAREIQSLVVKYMEPRKYWALLCLLNEVAKTQKSGEELIKMCMAQYISVPVGLGYTNYDINKPFIEQAKENMKELEAFYKKTKDLYEELLTSFEKITGKLFDEEMKRFEEYQ